jgi:hypothetical protein
MKALAVLFTILATSGALAATQQHQGTLVLKCRLAHSAQDGIPNTPFVQHFRISWQSGRVDGVEATISDDKIGWRPRQREFGPYATLSRPTWQFHSAPFYRGHAPDQVDGSCVEVH